MKCAQCDFQIDIKLATNIFCNGGSVLSSMTTILTVKCNNCGQVSQIPVQGKNKLSIKRDESS